MEEEVGEFDIYDMHDDPSRALVMYKPLLSFGISDNILPGIWLFPNPTQGVVSLQFTNSNRQYSNLKIVDVFGKVVETR
jgi:hypothetical protein